MGMLPLYFCKSVQTAMLFINISGLNHFINFPRTANKIIQESYRTRILNFYPTAVKPYDPGQRVLASL